MPAMVLQGARGVHVCHVRQVGDVQPELHEGDAHGGDIRRRRLDSGATAAPPGVSINLVLGGIRDSGQTHVMSLRSAC